VTAYARVSQGLFRILSRIERDFAFLSTLMAARAVDTQGEHLIGIICDADPTGSHIHFPRPQVNLLDMASITTVHETGHRRRFSHFVLDLGVASIAFDLSIGDVPLMEKFRGERNIEEIMFSVTFEALVLRNVPIALVNAHVAIEAVHPPVDISLMVEAGTPDQNIPFRLNMTRSAFPARKALILPLGSSVVKMADEAINFGYLEMAALADSIVARVTP
jgi:hypothetical protein